MSPVTSSSLSSLEDKHYPDPSHKDKFSLWWALYKLNYIAYALLCGAWLAHQVCLWDSCMLLHVVHSLSLYLSSILLREYNLLSLLLDIWVVSTWRLLEVMLLWIFLNMSFGGWMCISFGGYLDHRACTYLVFNKYTTKQFPQWLYWFLHSSVWEF